MLNSIYFERCLASPAWPTFTNSTSTGTREKVCTHFWYCLFIITMIRETHKTGGVWLLSSSNSVTKIKTVTSPRLNKISQLSSYKNYLGVIYLQLDRLINITISFIVLMIIKGWKYPFEDIILAPTVIKVKAGHWWVLFQILSRCFTSFIHHLWLKGFAVESLKSPLLVYVIITIRTTLPLKLYETSLVLNEHIRLLLHLCLVTDVKANSLTGEIKLFKWISINLFSGT